MLILRENSILNEHILRIVVTEFCCSIFKNNYTTKVKKERIEPIKGSIINMIIRKSVLWIIRLHLYLYSWRLIKII